MRKTIGTLRLMLSVLGVVILAFVCTGCGSQRSGPGTLQFYTSGGDIVRQGLLAKDGWQLTFDHVYVTMAEITAYQTDPPYDPVYSADIIRYETSTALDGTHTVDLKGGEDASRLVGEVADAKAGAYNAVSWKMVPASTGDAAGFSLVLIGKAETEGQTINFDMRFDWEASFLCGDYFLSGADLKASKGRLDPGGTSDLEMTFALDSVFGDGRLPAASVLNRDAFGFEPLAALAQDAFLDVDTGDLQAALSGDDYQALEKALTEIGYTGARLCYHME
jgi:hypothetical protein